MTTPAQRVDVAELQRAIEQAEHKPGEWHVSAFTFGAAAIREAADVPGGFQPFNETIIGNFPWKRDGWLAVAAVNALPALLHQLAERAAEVERLSAELDFMTANYERQTAYMVNHRGGLVYASSGMRDAYSEEHVRAEAAERAREECVRLAEKWERISSTHGVRCFTGDDHLIFANELRVALGQKPAAFLAANGGRDE